MIMYYVERQSPSGWQKISFTEHRRRCYCDGYVDAYDSMYPSNPMRIVKKEEDGTTSVVRETKGRGEVHTN